MIATSNECNNCVEFDGSAIDNSFAIGGKGSGILGRSYSVHACQFPSRFSGGMTSSVHAMVNPGYMLSVFVLGYLPLYSIIKRHNVVALTSPTAFPSLLSYSDALTLTWPHQTNEPRSHNTLISQRLSTSFRP